MAGKPKTRAAKKAREEEKAARLKKTGSTRKPRVNKPIDPKLKAAREAGLTVFGHLPATWDKFLERYVITCQQTLAAKDAGLHLSSVRARCLGDSKWNVLFEEARKSVIAQLEDEGMRRAIHGVTRNVHYQGEVIDTITDYSDNLLSFMLQANDVRYRKQQELNIKGNLNAGLTDAELDAAMKAKQEELAKLEAEG